MSAIALRARRSFIAAHLATLVCFLALDACWLSWMGPRLYRPALGDLMSSQVDWLAAALFYLAYTGGLAFFAVRPAQEAGQARVALRRGALLGLMAYATYDLTNQATLHDWPWAITLSDLAWGAVASASAAGLAARLTSRPSSRRTSR